MSVSTFFQSTQETCDIVRVPARKDGHSYVRGPLQNPGYTKQEQLETAYTNLYIVWTKGFTLIILLCFLIGESIYSPQRKTSQPAKTMRSMESRIMFSETTADLLLNAPLNDEQSLETESTSDQASSDALKSVEEMAAEPPTANLGETKAHHRNRRAIVQDSDSSATDGRSSEESEEFLQSEDPEKVMMVD